MRLWVQKLKIEIIPLVPQQLRSYGATRVRGRMPPLPLGNLPGKDLNPGRQDQGAESGRHSPPRYPAPLVGPDSRGRLLGRWKDRVEEYTCEKGATKRGGFEQARRECM